MQSDFVQIPYACFNLKFQLKHLLLTINPFLTTVSQHSIPGKFIFIPLDNALDPNVVRAFPIVPQKAKRCHHPVPRGPGQHTYGFHQCFHLSAEEHLLLLTPLGRRIHNARPQKQNPHTGQLRQPLCAISLAPHSGQIIVLHLPDPVFFIISSNICSVKRHIKKGSPAGKPSWKSR
jgi:hypothetical protein